MIVLKIFDFFREHATARWTSLLALTLVLLASILRLSYKEDIQDFLLSAKQTGSGWPSIRTSRA